MLVISFNGSLLFSSKNVFWIIVNLYTTVD